MSESAIRSSIGVRAVGGPTAILELAGLRLLTDPTFDEPGRYERGSGRFLTKTEGPALTTDEVGRIDAVLLSHDQHADNLDTSGREFLSSVPLTVTTPDGAERLGGTTRPLPRWNHLGLPCADGGSLRITAVPAQHGPEGSDPITGPVTGFVLSGAGLPTVYVSGDNASLDVVRRIAQRLGPIDIAILFAGAARTALFDGAPLTLTSEDAAVAAAILGVRAAVPLHFQGWEHFSEGAGSLRAAFAAAGSSERLHLLNPGESVRV